MNSTKNLTISAMFFLIFYIILGTLMYNYMENWGYVSSFYFTVTTLTTVGYGDLHPTTQVSQLFTAFYILIGVTTVVAASGYIGDAFINRRAHKVATRKSKNLKDQV